MSESELHQYLARIQGIVEAETGKRLGAQGQDALVKLLRNISSHNVKGAEGFAPTDITILFADLRGFTAISSRYPAATVLKCVNRCLITMSEVVFRHQGTIDKFMGDAIMVLFDSREGAEDPVHRALHCGVDLQLAMDELNEHYAELGLPSLYLGIGINTGSVMAGTLGSDFYAAYTVIGDEVNLASRIEAFSLRGQVLVSQRSFELSRGFAATAEPMTVHVKGKHEPITVHEVLGIPSAGKSVPRREIRKSPRVKARVPFSFHVVETDITMPEAHHGMILDIGYHGVLAEVDVPFEPLTELCLEIDFALVNHRARDVYARVVKCSKAESGYLCGIEFTSVDADTTRSLQLFVQLLIQGSEVT
jgi:adenylate cyclase